VGKVLPVTGGVGVVDNEEEISLELPKPLFRDEEEVGVGEEELSAIMEVGIGVSVGVEVEVDGVEV